MGPLVKYLEGESLRVPIIDSQGHANKRRVCITSDFQRLMATNSEIQFIVQAATEIQQKGLINEVDELDKQLENMKRVLEQTQYLSDLNDEVLY
jgi:hypothetical protein